MRLDAAVPLRRKKKKKKALEAAIRVGCTNSRQCADKLPSVLLVSDNNLSVTETYGSFFFLPNRQTSFP